MVEAAIDMVAGVGSDTTHHPRILKAVWRDLRRTVVRVRAGAELSCIDQRLREDAGVTPQGYLAATLRR